MDVKPIQECLANLLVFPGRGSRSRGECGIESLFRLHGFDKPAIWWCDSPLQAVIVAGLSRRMTEQAPPGQLKSIADELRRGRNEVVLPFIQTETIEAYLESIISTGLVRSEQLISSQSWMNSCRHALSKSDLHNADVVLRVDEYLHDSHVYSLRRRFNMINSPTSWDVTDLDSISVRIFQLSALDDLIASQLASQCGTEWLWSLHKSTSFDIRTHLGAYWILNKMQQRKGRLNLEDKLEQELEAWFDVCESSLYIVCFQNQVFASDFPLEVHRDDLGRLHSDTGPAVRFRDGYSIFAWRGAIVPKAVIDRQISIEMIEQEQNIEIRTTMINLFGVREYVLNSGMQLIHADEFGVLYEKSQGVLEPIKMVQVVNRTPEPDGTHNSYFLRVPPWVSTARQAIAWTFDMDAASYNPDQES